MDDRNKAASEILALKEKIKNLESKPKSTEMLELLQDINSNGAILSIERIPPENVYFQAGRGNR